MPTASFAVQPASFSRFDEWGCEWATDINHAYRLIHYSIVLTIHPLGCLALTFFPKEDDRMLGRFVEVNLYLIERIVAFG